MDGTLTPAPARVVRARMARAVLGPPATPEQLGEITLYPHQQSAVARVRRLLHQTGGALLADDVGLGKSFVALAIAREAAAPLLVVPAALRAMWRDRLQRAGVGATITSYSALSRGGVPEGDFDLLVLDEAHHARTPTTRRYAQLARLAARARVLLLSATPVHNSRRDLAALLALFLGGRAWSLDDRALLRCVIRRRHEDVDGTPEALDATPRDGARRGARDRIARRAIPLLPALADAVWLCPGSDPLDDDVLECLLALPPPVPPSDGGRADALVALSLLRQWASSDAALRGAVSRRLARATALEAALGAGRHLARAELAAWLPDAHTVQLAFPELLAATDGRAAASLLAAVRAHAAALRALAGRVARSTADARRAALLGALRHQHGGERIVAFAGYADTVRALYALLRAGGGVCALSGRGGVVAGGPISRGEALARFAPRAAGVRPPGRAERIEMLLTTDLSSEGVDLHDASVVVHLDLPWTAARMEQRVGRSRRIGAAHARTHVYLIAPPAGAERVVRAEERLRAKLAAAARTTGAARVLPAGRAAAARVPAPASPATGTARSAMDDVHHAMGAAHQTEDAVPAARCVAPAAEEKPRDQAGAALFQARLDRGTRPERHEAGAAHEAAHEAEALRALLERWAAAADRDVGDSAVCLVAAVHAAADGVLALVRRADEARLLAGAVDGPFTDATDAVRALAAAAGGADEPVHLPTARRAAESARRWCEARAGAEAAGLDEGVAEIGAPARRGAIRRIANITARAPPHRRAAIAHLALAARRAAIAPFGVGAERVLGALVAAPLPDEAWLRALGAFGHAHARGGASTASDAPALRSSRTAPGPAGCGGEPWRLAALLLLLPERVSR